MPATEKYTQLRDGVWYVGATDVSLYSVISMWRQGFAPEEIPVSFPALSLRQAYGAILFYLEHREKLDDYFLSQDALFAAQKETAEATNAPSYADKRARIARQR